MSIRQDVNKLLDWYDENDKSVTRVPVLARPNTLRKFCKKKRGDPRLIYRGREIVPNKLAKKEVDDMQQFGIFGEEH